MCAYLGDLDEVEYDLGAHVVVDALEDFRCYPVAHSIEPIAQRPDHSSVA
jgi:hypothetical protein